MLPPCFENILAYSIPSLYRNQAQIALILTYSKKILEGLELNYVVSPA
jgi:hypothetical protein